MAARPARAWLRLQRASPRSTMGCTARQDLHAVQLVCALSAELRAQPELAHCSDLGAFFVKKYAPAVERARELVPSKTQALRRVRSRRRAGAARPRRRVRPRLRPRLRVRLGGQGARRASSVRAASSALTTTPTTTPRRRRCTASSPRWRVSASISGRICSPIPGLNLAHPEISFCVPRAVSLAC